MSSKVPGRLSPRTESRAGPERLDARYRREGHRTPNHESDHLLVIEFGGGRRAHVSAVAEHGDRVGEHPHLLHAVGDPDHGRAPRPQPLDHVVQTAGLGGGERTGWLVEDEEFELGGESPGDLDELRLGDREAGDERVNIEREAERVEQGCRLGPHRWKIERRRPWLDTGR